MTDSKIKRLFSVFFEKHNLFESRHTCLRPFDPKTDGVIKAFTGADWNLMFPNVDEDTFNRWPEDNIHMVLTGFDRETKILFGILVFVQMKNPDNAIYVHGGTWKPNLRSTLLAYECLHNVLQYLINKGFEIYSSCFTTNLRADMFLSLFGFEEFYDDGCCSYKYLEPEKFTESDIPERLEHCFKLTATPKKS